METQANHKIAAGICKLLSEEALAREFYENFLACHSELDAKDVASIREIQADEFNHALKLHAMMLKYDGGIYPTSDGVENAITAIEGGIEYGDE